MILELGNLFAFLALGLGLGVLHAFDPDHIAAVGGMSASHNSKAKPLWIFSLHWSLGHGSALILVALAVFVLGAAVPETLSSLAERSVGLVLILIALVAFYRIAKQHETHRHQFAAPVVGLLHGTAGSAPLLALIPLAQLSQPAVGVFYVLFFSLGVLMAMSAFGHVLAYGFRQLSQHHALWLRFAQLALASFSLAFGLYLLVSGL